MHQKLPVRYSIADACPIEDAEQQPVVSVQQPAGCPTQRITVRRGYAALFIFQYSKIVAAPEQPEGEIKG